MVKLFKSSSRFLIEHRYGFTLFAFIASAAFTGMACVLFMRGFEFFLRHRIDFLSAGRMCWLITPVIFLLCAELIRNGAPYAAGTGIPQAIFASQNMHEKNERKLFPLLSPVTLLMKILTLYLAIWAGASTGREGPTVHVATCIFFGIVVLFRNLTGFKVDLRSVVVAGGAAGLAAAFNTPLAGVTFAIEELVTNYFGNMKDFVILSIIIAAIVAKSMTGEYLYFGKLAAPKEVSLVAILLIGISGGILGAFFSTAILQGQKFFDARRKGICRLAIPIVLSMCLLGVALMAGTRVLGPGNQPAQELMRGHFENWTYAFPLAKMAATLFTYWSGIAGGIFAPCLGVGAAMGANIGHFLHLSVESCALIGMAAFLSGTIQAPMTSFVIIFEMTGHHTMLLPVMLSSLLAFITARLFGAKHLYQALAENYGTLSKTAASPSPQSE